MDVRIVILGVIPVTIHSMAGCCDLKITMAIVTLNRQSRTGSKRNRDFDGGEVRNPSSPTEAHYPELRSNVLASDSYLTSRYRECGETCRSFDA